MTLREAARLLRYTRRTVKSYDDMLKPKWAKPPREMVQLGMGVIGQAQRFYSLARVKDFGPLWDAAVDEREAMMRLPPKERTARAAELRARITAELDRLAAERANPPSPTAAPKVERADDPSTWPPAPPLPL